MNLANKTNNVSSMGKPQVVGHFLYSDFDRILFKTIHVSLNKTMI
jgi:hypothetical protein